MRFASTSRPCPSLPFASSGCHAGTSPLSSPPAPRDQTTSALDAPRNQATSTLNAPRDQATSASAVCVDDRECGTRRRAPQTRRPTTRTANTTCDTPMTRTANVNATPDDEGRERYIQRRAPRMRHETPDARTANATCDAPPQRELC